MAPLLPKHLLSIRKKEAAAILVLVAVHASAAMVVDDWESGNPCLYENLTTPFLYCQLGLLAWWVSLTGPRRFWKVVLSLTMLVLLIAIALRQMTPLLRYMYGTFDWYCSPHEPWNQVLWTAHFSLSSSFTVMTAPFVFALLAVLGWLVPCKITHQRQQSDAANSRPPNHAWRAGQFGVGDMLAGTAAIAAVTGLITWVQPYPTWIVEYGYYAVVHTRTFWLLLIPNIITVVLGTWFSGNFLLGQTIRPRHLTILLLVVAINSATNVLIEDVIVWVALGLQEHILDPWSVWLTLKSTFLVWIAVAGSFLLLRMAGFRIYSARSNGRARRT